MAVKNDGECRPRSLGSDLVRDSEVRQSPSPRVSGWWVRRSELGLTRQRPPTAARAFAAAPRRSRPRPRVARVADARTVRESGDGRQPGEQPDSADGQLHPAGGAREGERDPHQGGARARDRRRPLAPRPFAFERARFSAPPPPRPARRRSTTSTSRSRCWYTRRSSRSRRSTRRRSATARSPSTARAAPRPRLRLADESWPARASSLALRARTRARRSSTASRRRPRSATRA